MTAEAVLERAAERRGRQGPPRPEKVAAVEEIARRLGEAKSVVLVDTHGLDIPETNELRSAFRKAGIFFRVYKNRLLARALAGAGVELPGDALTGETAVAFSPDEAAAAKIVHAAYEKNERPKFKVGLAAEGGAFRIVPVEELEALAKLPSREEIFAKLLGLMSGPARAVLSVLQGSAGGVVRLLDAWRKMLEEGGK